MNDTNRLLLSMELLRTKALLGLLDTTANIHAPILTVKDINEVLMAAGLPLVVPSEISK